MFELSCAGVGWTAATMVKLTRMILQIVRIEVLRIDSFASIAALPFESLQIHTRKSFANRFENPL
jgi:hypothetical protein